MGRPAIVTMMVLISCGRGTSSVALSCSDQRSRRTIPLGLALFQGQHSSDFRCWPPARDHRRPVWSCMCLPSDSIIAGCFGSIKE